MNREGALYLIGFVAVSALWIGLGVMIGMSVAHDGPNPERQVLNSYCDSQDPDLEYAESLADSVQYENGSILVRCSPNPPQTPIHTYKLVNYYGDRE